MLKLWYIFSIILLLTGCGGNGSFDSGQVTSAGTAGVQPGETFYSEGTVLPTVYAETPEESLKAALNSLKKGNKPAGDRYYDYDEVVASGSREDQPLYSPFKTFTYRILSEEIEDGTAYFRVKIVNKDLNTMIKRTVDDVNKAMVKPKNAGLNKKQRQVLLQKIFNKTVKKCRKKLTTTVTVKVTGEPPERRVDISESVLNAIYGRRPVSG